MSGRPEGRHGGTAQQKADRLRVKAERLARQADAWVIGVEREPAVARKLAELPRNFVLLRDLPIDASGTYCDHLVIGPGGLYLVDAKKYSGKLLYSKKMLWHGRFPITEKLENVQYEAERLSEALGRNVVPVLCFLDQVLPQPVTTLGPVIVCRVSVLSTVVRSTHTTISPGEMERILAVASDLAGEDLVSGEVRSVSDVPPVDVDARPATVRVDTVPVPIAPADKPEREPKAHRLRRPVLLTIVAIVAVAATVGAVLGASRWQEDKAATQATATDPTVTTVAQATTTSAPRTTTTTAATEEEPTFRASCPSTGGGWTMVPVWPGTFSGLAYYDYAVQNFVANTWDTLGYMATPDPGAIRITGLGPQEKRIVRIIAALSNGTASDPRFVLVTAPAEAC